MLLSLFVLLCVVLGVLEPPSARAGTFSGQILLGFTEVYGNGTRHSGVDVAWDPGSNIYAPVSGTISYVGRVPAAASSGQTVTAVTITTEEGHLVSLNPLATTAISRGDVITKGQPLGTLSAFGDPSSDEPHVHLSLRVGGVYRDPSHLIEETLGVVAGTLPPSSAYVPPAGTTLPVAQAELSVAPAPAANTVSVPGAATAYATESVRAGTAASAMVGNEAFMPQMSASRLARFEQAGVGVSTSAGMASYAYPSRAAVTSRTPSLWQQLSTGQLAGILYACGVLIPCLAVGALVIGRKMGIRIPEIAQFRHAFAHREGK